MVVPAVRSRAAVIDPASVIVVGDSPSSSADVATPIEAIRPPLAVSAYDVTAKVESAFTVTSKPAMSVPATVADTDGVPFTEVLGNGKSRMAPVPPTAIALETPSPAGGTTV